MNISYREIFQREYKAIVHELCVLYGEDGRYLETSLIEGGKFVRPYLYLEASLAWGISLEKTHYQRACAIELIHNFLLIHDDIMDDDEYRRDRQTLHTFCSEGRSLVEGRARALVYGDIVYTEAIALLVSTSLSGEVLHHILDIIRKTAQGQVFEMNRQTVPSETELIRFYEMKTALYSIYLPLMMAGSEQNDKIDQPLIKQYASHMGISYQLYDDVIEVLGQKQRREDQRCGDIARLKITPLLLKTFELLAHEEREKYHEYMKQGIEIEAKDEEYLLQLMKEKGVIRDTIDILKQHVSKAESIRALIDLENIPILTMLANTYAAL